MSSPVLPLTIATAAATADGAGHHQLAFYLVLLAIPAAAGSALAATGEVIEGRATCFRIVCTAGALVLLVLSSAARSNATEGGGIPAIAISALVAAVAVYGSLGVAWLARPQRIEARAPATAAAPVGEPAAESRAA